MGLANRRQDARYQVAGLRIRIRRHGVSRLLGYDACFPVDLCANGFAFRSGHLRLRPMRKVDFLLAVGDQQVEGTALIRHAQECDGLFQYGAFVLRSDRDLDCLLDASVLDTREIDGLARRMAQELAFRHYRAAGRDPHGEWQKVRLCDAVSVFRRRMQDLGLAIALDGETLRPFEALRIDTDSGRVWLRLPGADGVPVERCIELELEPGRGEASYVVKPDQRRLGSLFELLQYLGDAWLEAADLRRPG